MGLHRLVIFLLLSIGVLAVAGCSGSGFATVPTPVKQAEKVSSSPDGTQTPAIGGPSEPLETATPTLTPTPTMTPTPTPNLAATNRWQFFSPLEGINVSAIAVSPDYANDKTFFVGTLTTTSPSNVALGSSMVTGGLYKTGDEGRTWKEVSTTLSKWGITALGISPDYAKDKTILAGVYGSFPASEGNPASADARLNKSRDGGLNWSPAQTGLPDQIIKQIVFSPDYLTDRSILVALGGLNQPKLNPPRGGVYQSINSASKWAPLGYGLPPDLPATSIGFSPNYAADGVIFAGVVSAGTQPSDRGGIFRTQDKGLNWLSMAPGMPQAFSQANSFSVSPNYAKDFTIFAVPGAGSGDVKGIYRSTDGGAKWQLASNGLDDYVVAVVVSPNYPSDSTVYAATRNSGVFRTTNAGLNWFPINDGLSSYNTTALAVVPGQSPILLVGIENKGLYRYVDKH